MNLRNCTELRIDGNRRGDGRLLTLIWKSEVGFYRQLGHLTWNFHVGHQCSKVHDGSTKMTSDDGPRPSLSKTKWCHLTDRGLESVLRESWMAQIIWTWMNLQVYVHRTLRPFPSHANPRMSLNHVLVYLPFSFGFIIANSLHIKSSKIIFQMKLNNDFLIPSSVYSQLSNLKQWI